MAARDTTRPPGRAPGVQGLRRPLADERRDADAAGDAARSPRPGGSCPPRGGTPAPAVRPARGPVQEQSASTGTSFAALLTPAVLRASPTFAPDFQPADRQAILTAIGGTRPEARRLVGVVDGLVTIRVGPTGGQAVGLTSGHDGHFDMVLDLGSVYRSSGERGVSRLVLHEFGHVIDAALVPGELKRRLDAEIPAGYPCGAGQPFGACAPRAERFAETFAKWATGDLGVDVYLGYKVLVPAALED